ncbi:MAG: 23S rRNA (adenine(2503)-C(2))-methyltransferase RlmN [Prevotella sp.]|nr:23S rRNA (adenine(2503)-C(2))-methyltransferase RlmN [Prevotella sp.]
MIRAKKPLLGLTTAEMRTIATEMGLPAFTGRQMAEWIYEKHVTSIDEMTNLSKTARQRLQDDYAIGTVPPLHCQRSVDGTIKYLFPVSQGGSIETVFIPDGERATLCVSCQVGCKMNCLFCQTGKQGFEGNLNASDILNQIYSVPEWEQLTNVVFMGQGEPMDNLDAVLRATEILTATDGYGWSPKRITVSSVGVKSKLKRFLDESQCHVAISMHSPLHEQRLSMMPAEKAMPISETVDLLRQYDFSHQRRCSFEYICFGGLNDSLAHGKEIVRLVEGLECRVNLIRFHTIPGVDLPASNMSRMEQLRDYLTQHGVFATIRASRGEDILAACGLLSTAHKNQL